MNFKKDFKNSLISAVMATPTLMMIIFSSAYQILSENSYTTDIPLVLGIITLAIMCATLVISFLYRKDFVPTVYAVLFGLSFFVYLVFYTGSATDVSDGMQAITLVLTLPIYSIMGVSEAINTNPIVPSLIISSIITVINILLAVFTVRISKKEQEELARAEAEIKAKAENNKARNRGRKVR